MVVRHSQLEVGEDTRDSSSEADDEIEEESEEESSEESGEESSEEEESNYASEVGISRPKSIIKSEENENLIEKEVLFEFNSALKYSNLR